MESDPNQASESVQAALSSGNLQRLLLELDRGVDVEGIRDPSTDSNEKLEEAQKTHETILHQLLTYALSASFLSRDVSEGSALAQVLATLRANLGLLPAIGERARPLDHMLATNCDAEELETASEALAQRAACTGDELVEAWNAMAPSEHAVSSVADMTPAIHALRVRAERTREQTATVDVAISDAQRTCLALLHAATRDAIHATDIDTAERARSDAADVCRVSMLQNRGQATIAKMRLVRAEVTAMTYTDETIPALAAISAAVRQRLQTVQHELQEKSARLEEYRALGPEFEHTVAEYVRVKDKLDQVLWSKRELGLT